MLESFSKRELAAIFGALIIVCGFTACMSYRNTFSECATTRLLGRVASSQSR
jgi:hypothetical protein